jgi:protein associated with RNAse G/E
VRFTFPHHLPWAASYYDSVDQPISVYVDVTTPAVWDGPLVTMVDLDLDVIMTRDGDLLLDDEDEFDEHQVTLGYPAEVVALARRTADELMTAAAAGREPFGPAGSRWLAHRATSTP